MTKRSKLEKKSRKTPTRLEVTLPIESNETQKIILDYCYKWGTVVCQTFFMLTNRTAIEIHNALVLWQAILTFQLIL